MKILYSSQLRIKHSTHHDSIIVRFIDTDNTQKTGVYRPINQTYSSLSAIFVVAYSVRMRRVLGESVSEEYIVLDDKSNIQGTVSIDPPNFKPMLPYSSQAPADYQEKEIVCPSVETLLSHSFAEKLVAEVISENDDACPQHVSLMGLINHQKRGYRITRWFVFSLGKDWLDQDINRDFSLKTTDIDNFPNVKGRTHYPANSYNFNFHRHFMAADAI
ncbi:hypothetical protein [Legionella clemsonensis]|uniref:Uncharacterized protein n=1 Tax=Legionella clemsonensis TaxID=1867846 RepID=A0A222NYG8_9GAMM|nr:hypothetical protein [Legionella clemsonensis]ASQ44626.1 hypothetical protein clem_00295 [Legionella clemsonensis]